MINLCITRPQHFLGSIIIIIHHCPLTHLAPYSRLFKSYCLNSVYLIQHGMLYLPVTSLSNHN